MGKIRCEYYANFFQRSIFRSSKCCLSWITAYMCLFESSGYTACTPRSDRGVPCGISEAIRWISHSSYFFSNRSTPLLRSKLSQNWLSPQKRNDSFFDTFDTIVNNISPTLRLATIQAFFSFSLSIFKFVSVNKEPNYLLSELPLYFILWSEQNFVYPNFISQFFCEDFLEYWNELWTGSVWICA